VIEATDIAGTARPARRRLRRRVTRLLVIVAASVGMVVGLNSPAMASGEFESVFTTMIIREDGLYVDTVEVAIWTSNAARGDVQAKVWGAGFSGGWTRSEDVGSFTTYRGFVKVDRVLREGEQLCAEGFWGTQSIGLPCATIER
jgi:hypothetical protein